jgi:hypothetical protein
MSYESEFPQTRWSKLGSKIGWLFSPLLLIGLIIFTLFNAEKLNLTSEGIQRKGSVEIRQIKNGVVYFNDNIVGKVPGIYDTVNTELLRIKIKKDGKRDWERTIAPKPGFVKVYSPILYPTAFDFTKQELEIKNFYTKDNSNFFFYERVVGDRILIYKYSINKQIFSVQVKNDIFADITDLVKIKNPEITKPEDLLLPQSTKIKAYDIIPSNDGKKLLMIFEGENISIISEGAKVQNIPNIIPTKESKFYWTPNDGYILYKINNEIYSFEVDSAKTFQIYKQKSIGEQVDIQFLLDDTFVFKVENELSDLVQDSYQGNQLRKIEIPNTRLDNLRKKNLLRAYDFLEKKNLILIQTNENIYSYDVTSSELKKMNRFKGEEIVYVDAGGQIVLSINKENENQMKLYNFDQPEDTKTFAINDTGAQKSKFNKVIGFNGSQNFIIVYDNKLEFIDSDGSNKISIPNLRNPDVVLAQRVDDTVEIAITESFVVNNGEKQIEQYKLPNYNLKFERFEN